ncbi:MAG: hypothetical protein FJ146_05200 [Deltaproteobacteria bacterium]|nr:hypothetical protein [Deltaproteobacteria bacterium]
MSRLFGVICLALAGASAVARAQDFDYESILKAEPRSTGGYFTVSSGVGLFQDIQVPMNPRTGVRANGSTDKAENQTHLGIPIGLAIGQERALGAHWHVRPWEITGTKMGASNGAPGTNNATYTRLGLSSGLRRTWTAGAWQLDLGGHVELRRSAFGNAAESHFINATLLGSQLRLGSGNYSLEVGGEVAPKATFGYSPGGFFGGSPFPGSTAKLMGYSIVNALLIDRNVWIDLGLSTEMATVVIPDVSYYEGYGLAARNLDSSSRRYQLTTQTVRLGLRRLF